MATGLTELSEHEERFGEIAFAYLRALEEGRRPDAREWLARYPAFGPELADFFANQEAMDRLGAPLRELARAGERPSTEWPNSPAPKVGAAPRPPLPRSLGDYELLEEMARGGMGVVYRARQMSLNRLVALKVIRAGEWATSEEIRRFRNEAETVALLDQAHIVPVYDVGEDAGQVYFSMKLVAGGNLAEQLDRFPGDPNAAADLLATVTRAVHHAHQRGILHRDLKPSNILLDEHGQPHVTDFGLARRVEADSSLTQSGVIVGTPSYIAPEQATGRKAAATTATDVYGLGAILYALLTGRPPFQADNALETLVQVREREPQLPRAANRRVARDLETICLTCLAKEPRRRYPSALALAEDLDRFLAGKPIQARPVGVWERGIKWSRRRPLAAAVGGLVLAVLLLGGAVLAREVWQRAAIERAVEPPLERAELLQRQERYEEALGILTVAASQLEGRGLGALRQRVQQRKRDADLLMRLEEARLQVASGGKETTFDYAGADRLYEAAFKAYGLDLTVLDAETAAQRLRSSSISNHLAQGLDHWAFIRDTLGLNGGQLRAVADLADDDSWRRRLREASGRPDGEVPLEGLATEPGAMSQPTSYLVLLTIELRSQRLASRRAKQQLRQGVPIFPGQIRASKTAELLLRQAQQLRPADYFLNYELASLLMVNSPPNAADAIGFARAAVAIRPQSPSAHNALGGALHRLGNLADAEAALRKAVALNPDHAGAHFNLGQVLRDRGRFQEAEAAYREAIRARPSFVEAHINRGAILKDVLGRPREAEAAFRETLRLEPDSFRAYDNLGQTLRAQGDADGAIASYRAAIKLKSDCAEAHCHLGQLLGFGKGQFAEALIHLRRGHELGMKQPGWPHPSAQLVKECERCLELDSKLPGLLKGEVEPADVGECLALAQLCQAPCKSLHVAALRFYTRAFAAQPQLIGAQPSEHRYNAACAAVLAGCGQGKDSDELDAQERVCLRRQALGWLHDDLKAYRRTLDKAPGKTGPTVAQQMQHWLRDDDLAGVRGAVALSKLPADESPHWRNLWEEVDSLGKRAAGSSVPATPTPGPDKR